MARVPLIEESDHPELAESIAKIKGARGGRCSGWFYATPSTLA